MFGSFLGAIASAPIRILNAPVKIAERTAQAADEFMLGKSSQSYRAPRRNVLDRAAETVERSCEDAIDG